MLAVVTHTFVSAAIIAIEVAVAVILYGRGETEITWPVVVRIAIDVIDYKPCIDTLLIREHPCDHVDSVLGIADPNATITFLGALLPFPASSLAPPYKLSGIGV
nr:hypothetical protein [Noviherbaspirillum soli]